MALDRRQFTRHTPTARVSVKLGSNNRGMLVNLSEGGLAFQVVAPVATNDALRFRCALGHNQTIEATGEIIWTRGPGNTGGLRFLDLPEASRKRIAEWLVKLPLDPMPERAEPPRDIEQDVSPGAESPALGAVAPAASGRSTAAAEARSSESLRVRNESPPIASLGRPRGESRLLQRQGDWPALGYDWLQKPPRKQKVVARAGRSGLSIEWLLLAIPIGIVIGALIPWPRISKQGAREARSQGSFAPQKSQAQVSPLHGSVGAALAPPAAPMPSPTSNADGEFGANVSRPPEADTQAGKQSPAQPAPQTHAPPPATAAPATPTTDHDSQVTPAAPGEKELIQALRYLNGTYGRKDTPAAITWFWQAVQKGNQDAVVRLAGLYLRGEGVPKNCDQARILLTSAVQKGNREAARRLETLIASGCP